MPPSISHEGYSAKPQYSLWDDFWALRGYKDAADIADTLGKPEAAQDCGLARRIRRRSPRRDRCAARDHWKIDYIPGATSLGDFDATSTTIALDPGGEQARLIRAARRHVRTLLDAVSARRGGADWKDYTPYELRNVAASSGSAGASGPTSCSTSSWPTGARRRGTMGRSRRPGSARNPLHRRHAACLGRVGFHPRRARHVRL